MSVRPVLTVGSEAWLDTPERQQGSWDGMDDVPIPLRPAFKSPHPSDYDVLTAVEKRVRALKAS